MDIYAIDTLFQTSKFLPCVVGLVVVLSVFLRVVTSKGISTPVVILATGEGGVLDEETCYIHRIFYSGILVIALCLFLLALLNGLFCTFNGSVQLFERAVSVVVDGSLCGYVRTDGFCVFEQLLQLHRSVVGRHRDLECFDADAVGLNSCEPCIVSLLINHLPLCAGSGFEQIQASVGIFTLPAEELLRLCGHVRDEVIAILGRHLPETVGVCVVVGPDAIPCVSKGADHAALSLYVILQLYDVVAFFLGSVSLSEFDLDTADSFTACSAVAITASSEDQTCTCGPVVTVCVEQVAGHVVEINCLAHLVGRE